MTLALKIPGASFSKYAARVKMPLLDIANTYYLFGADADASRTNLVPGAANPLGTVIGAPTFHDGYAAFTSANGINALTTGGSPFTHIGVLRMTAGGWGFGNWSAGGNFLYGATDGLIKVAVAGNIRTTLGSGPILGQGFQLVAGTYDGTTAVAYVFNNDILTTAAAAFVEGATTNYALKFGGHEYSTHSFDMAAGLSFPTALTQSQIEEVYDYLKQLLPTRGVTMV
jgi:hypothetical protein